MGGGQSPLLDPHEIEKLGLEYTLLDISGTELAKAPPLYHKVRSDICAPQENAQSNHYDLMFSRMLAEHVHSGKLMHQNIYALLRPGGYAFHFFPTLYSPAFVVNWLLPERAARWALDSVLRGRPHHEKFPALYSWCRGPGPRHMRRLQKIGYDVLDFRSFYGTAYLRHITIAGHLETYFHRLAQRRRSRLFTSYAWLLLRKPHPP